MQPIQTSREDLVRRAIGEFRCGGKQNRLPPSRFPDTFPEMSEPRKTPLQTYRKRLAESNMARMEVIAPKADRPLIRSLARRLAEKGPEAQKLRATLREHLQPQSTAKGGLLRLLRHPAVVGEDLFPERPFTPAREIDL